MENIESWNRNYNLAKNYYKKNGNLLIPNRFRTKNGIDYDEDGILLGVWIRTQRKKYNKIIKPNITMEQIEALNKIGMVWKLKKYTAKDYIDLANKYYNYHGNLLIHERFKTQNGYEYNESGVNLGSWIAKQRNMYPNIKIEIRESLEKIGMVWYPYETRFDNMLELATNYYKKNGDLNIPLNFKTKNGIDYDNDGMALGSWLYNIKNGETGKGTMSVTPERLKKLKEIGYVANNRSEINYDKMIELVKVYYNYHGNTNIPQNFKTKNGIDYDKNGFNLGYWIRRQKKLKEENLLSQGKINKLNNINFNIDIYNQKEKWNHMYSLAANYYKYYNNLQITRSFKTINGYEKNQNGYKLGVWIQVQRNSYRNNKLEQDKINKLNSIEMIWDKNEYDFYNGKITLKTKKQVLKIFRDYLNSINENDLTNEDIKEINNEFAKILTYNKVK